MPRAPVELEANEAERAALAQRFGLVAIERLAATVTLDADGKAVNASGRLRAGVVQSCAVSGEDLPVTHPTSRSACASCPSARSMPKRSSSAATRSTRSSIAGDTFDLGEAVAQSLALAIDPYAVGPEAERARREAGFSDKGASGPFAALAALKKS